MANWKQQHQQISRAEREKRERGGDRERAENAESETRTRSRYCSTHIPTRGAGTWSSPYPNRARDPIGNRLARISFHICIFQIFHFFFFFVGFTHLHTHSHQHQYICFVSTREELRARARQREWDKERRDSRRQQLNSDFLSSGDYVNGVEQALD